MPSVRTPDPNPGWLSEFALDETRSRVPILYVEAVPVRVDALGRIEHVGLLLRGSASGELSRSLVSGRVLHGESVREALLRNLEKDLGPSGVPAASGLHDSRSPSPSTSRSRASRRCTTRASTRSPWSTSCRSPASALPARTPWNSPG